jgi:hypothetical protein
MLLHRLFRIALDDPHLSQRVLAAARAGWGPAVKAINDLLVECNFRGEVVPRFLSEYVNDLIGGRLRKMRAGRKKSTDILENIVIVTLAGTLMQRYGLKPTRYHLGRKRRMTACSVAAQAATIVGMHRGGEAAVEKIWQRWAPIVCPNLM